MFDIARSGFSIRPAGAADAKALKMLLPELRDPAVSFVAVDDEHNLVVGAAAAARAYRHQPLPGPGVAICVIEPCRRHGIGASLLEHLVRAIQSTGAKSLYAANRVPLDSEQMRQWQSLGFVACETVEEHTLPLAEFEPRLAPLVERMREQGKIPATAKIIPLYRANLPAVLQLHLDHMGGDRGQLYRKLRGAGPGAFHPRYSRILVVSDQVKGCILGHRTRTHTFAVDANIVNPSLRGGWANVWLKLEATRGALALGTKYFEFTTFDHYADTRSFLNKLGGTTTRSTVLMFRPLE